MQMHLLVGPIPINGFGNSYQWSWSHFRSRRLHPCLTRVRNSSSIEINGEQNHYQVLGLTRHATSSDIKRAYRFLARKYHPDVSKDSQAGEVFKSIHSAYQVLSNEETRTRYDGELLQDEEDMRRLYRSEKQDYYSSKSEDRTRIYHWAEVRRKMQYEVYWDHSGTENENSSDRDTDEEEDEITWEEGNKVLRLALLSLFLLQTCGSRLSLLFSCLIALFDRKLDAGYKTGYVIAWILGGRGGILLSLCLSFASWVCGKRSSSIVGLVVMAMWVGSSVARYAPLPQGAILTLLYMSIKLQADL